MRDEDFLAKCREEVLHTAITNVAAAGLKEEAVVLALALGIPLRAARVIPAFLQPTTTKPKDGIPF